MTTPWQKQKFKVENKESTPIRQDRLSTLYLKLIHVGEFNPRGPAPRTTWTRRLILIHGLKALLLKSLKVPLMNRLALIWVPQIILYTEYLDFWVANTTFKHRGKFCDLWQCLNDIQLICESAEDLTFTQGRGIFVEKMDGSFQCKAQICPYW